MKTSDQNLKCRQILISNGLLKETEEGRKMTDLF